MVKKKRGLGKGLSALIPEESVEEGSQDFNKVFDIDINLIEPNEKQPRRDFDQKTLQELAKSVLQHGVIQPIIVRKKNGGYEIIAGERRWKASKIAGLRKMPCIIKEIEKKESMEIALIENIQREDLNPIDEALAYNEIMTENNMTQEQLSDVAGKSRSYIANVVRLLNLDERVIELIRQNKISNGHGRALLSISDKELQYELALDIIERELTVRDIEHMLKENKKKRRKTQKNINKDSILLEIQDNLQKYFGTKVQINKGRKKGKIEIEYYNDEDLQRILESIYGKHLSE
ncbi:ParB/RepB/Spo0J family partition protein [Clostridiisalibacter paucivorans]|uniref:ParB/RepB/Spo0J family partition protein n=1 Tax=Clostridiisalibacter paucivorans TaxID=408753 RepID=UPI0004787AF5|nr:ParB/RepB/Spo0J family partition protein [Clostridiisalibacter paucivorans]